MRQWGALVFGLIALWSLWAALRPAPASGRQVVVARHELKIGHRISAGDLRTVSWPQSLPTPTTGDPSGLVGRRVTSAIAGGEPVTSRRVDSRRSNAALGDDRVGFAVPLTDGSLIPYLQPGDTVDLFSAADGVAPVPGARVISVTPTSSANATPPSMLVSVPRSAARDLATLLASSTASGSGVIASVRGGG